MRESLFRDFRLEYDEVATMYGITRRGTPEETARVAFEQLRGRLVFVPDSQNGAGTGERVARPMGICTNGGDCDDFVSLLGGIVRFHHPEARVASVYWPDDQRPSHVYLRVGDAEFDLTEPTWQRRADREQGVPFEWL